MSLCGARFPVILIAAAALAVAGAAPRVASASVARGIVDAVLTQPGGRMDLATQTEALDQIGPKLRATYVRFIVSWAVAEPEQGVYDETYLAGVDQAVALAKERGVKVMITFAYVPKWASDSSSGTTTHSSTRGTTEVTR